ncbi:gas vesicle protein GvpO [Geodermatophilus sp. SYSU D00815]
MPEKRDNGGIVSAVRNALEQFAGLTQLEPVAATGVRREQDGWSVLVDVVELERIPSTTSVMATYRVDLDGNGDLCGYERLRRFVRGSVDQS